MRDSAAKVISTAALHMSLRLSTGTDDLEWKSLQCVEPERGHRLCVKKKSGESHIPAHSAPRARQRP
ncbi:hypothetical protein BST61_g6067 [Cercospora zeina]